MTERTATNLKMLAMLACAPVLFCGAGLVGGLQLWCYAGRAVVRVVRSK